jgi:type IV pilus assembly protein PilE
MHGRGFTLIEVMVVVAIVAILAALAVPVYRDYVTRGRIPDALGPLADMQARMEQYFQDQRTYVGACQANTIAPLPPASKYFSFDCGTPTATGYTIRATGQNGMDGFVFQLSLSGGSYSRTTSSVPDGWALPSSNCWVTKKDGSC